MRMSRSRSLVKRCGDRLLLSFELQPDGGPAYATQHKDCPGEAVEILKQKQAGALVFPHVGLSGLWHRRKGRIQSGAADHAVIDRFPHSRPFEKPHRLDSSLGPTPPFNVVLIELQCMDSV